jgi:hypothetical protein
MVHRGEMSGPGLDVSGVVSKTTAQDAAGVEVGLVLFDNEEEMIAGEAIWVGRIPGGGRVGFDTSNQWERPTMPPLQLSEIGTFTAVAVSRGRRDRRDR